MIIQEPVQAAIWHCLNHYLYSDAIFLSERLYAEVKTDDSLYLLATSYFRNAQVDHAYHILKDRHGYSAQCKYLFGKCAYEMQKYSEAESAILENISCSNNNFDELIAEYGDQAVFALVLIANIAIKTERKARAVEALKKVLKLNPFLWNCYELLCKIGEKPDPNSIFQLGDLENLSKCHGHNIVNNIESMIITNNTPNQDSVQYIVTTPQIMINSVNQNQSINNISKVLFTPEDSSIPNPLALSGVIPFPSSKAKSYKHKVAESPLSPSFGTLLEHDDLNTPVSTLSEANDKSFTKKVRNLINRKDSILQNNKPVFSQSSNVPNMIPGGTPITSAHSLFATTGQNVRRSSRLFSSSYSVKENNKSPNRHKFSTPKSPSRKSKQRLATVQRNLNEFNAYLDLNTKNNMKKEKSSTVTSTDNNKNDGKNGAISNSNANTVSAIHIQKQSAEGLMCLLRNIGQAYLHLSQFNCKAAIKELQSLPPHQYETTWIYGMMGLAHFEMADYENCIKYFAEIHSREPYRIAYMDIYSTALWHLQREVTLSALAQDMAQLNKNHPIAWIVSGNCFSLHKEHDTAIKCLHRAVQVDQDFPYAYTLLGHEYIMTEELDKAMSCYRNAVRLDPRHYNAWFGIGTIYSKQERFHLAEHHYNIALSINCYNSVIMCHIGVVQHAQKKTEKALQSFNSAIRIDSKNPLSKFHRGSVYFALGKLEEALKELEEVREIVPKESLVYYLIGKIHKKKGNNDLALMHFSWATDLDPKGASSQIKEAFDPAVERFADSESPSSPAADDNRDADGNSVQQAEPLHRNLFFDSDSDRTF